MEKRRTVPVKLNVGSDDSSLLRDTVDEFLWAANYVTRHAFEGEYITTSKTALHDDTYEDVRDETPLHSNHVQAARNKAAEACKSVVEKCKQGKKASMPHFTSPHLVYDHRTATFHDGYVSLATTDGRIEADYVLPDEKRDTPHADYFFSDEYETTGAELHYTNGNWMLHIHCKKEVESDTPEQDATENQQTVLGVDLGVNNLAVASTGTFWTGDEFDHWRREYEKRRGDLQEHGTRWAHETMQGVGRKEEGRFKITLHRISNELVAEARDHECSVIAFEDLTDIRERTGASWGHKWAFNRLYEYIEYKATAYDIEVDQVPPKNTSRRCSTCGFTHPDNREGEEFDCQKCGYENHAGYNAAKNIGLRYLRRNQIGGDEGESVGIALNSGMLNANGEYEPPAEVVRDGEAVS
ncbi:RNA-guided endonuclease InsQ/TnpB family protein [Natronomonas sp.]|uniref:RNA-guided endonuclease InsQ/TnpB family protein n=1 Tax=Natronomonas sp. TaxID=2184060 RepID=UPI0026197E96|nr:transposase [Natronomonas sp.]